MAIELPLRAIRGYLLDMGGRIVENKVAGIHHRSHGCRLGSLRYGLLLAARSTPEEPAVEGQPNGAIHNRRIVAVGCPRDGPLRGGCKPYSDREALCFRVEAEGEAARRREPGGIIGGRERRTQGDIGLFGLAIYQSRRSYD